MRDKWEVAINFKPSLRLGSQEVVLGLTIQMSAYFCAVLKIVILGTANKIIPSHLLLSNTWLHAAGIVIIRPIAS